MVKETLKTACVVLVEVDTQGTYHLDLASGVGDGELGHRFLSGWNLI